MTQLLINLINAFEGRRGRRALYSAAASTAARAVSVATTLVSVPLTFHYLGQTDFGLWVTISSFLSVLSFADFGIGNGLLNVIAAADGRDDSAEMRRGVSNAAASLGIVALVLAGGTLSVFCFDVMPHSWFAGKHLEYSRIKATCFVFLMCFAGGLPLGIVQKVQIGLQQGFIVSGWQVLSSISTLSGVVLVISFRGGLPWLVGALTGVPLLLALANTLVFFGITRPSLRPNLAESSLTGIINLLGVGSLFLILQAASAITYGSDNLIIASILGARSVAQFAIPERLFSFSTMFTLILLNPLWPAYREALVRRDYDWAKRMVLRSILAASLLSAAICGVLVFASPWIIARWIGPSVRPTIPLLLGLAAWKLLEAVGNAMGMLMNGAHMMAWQATAAIVTAAVSLALEILLVRRIGVPGAVWGTIIAFGLFTIIPQLVFLGRFLGGKYDPRA